MAGVNLGCFTLGGGDFCFFVCFGNGDSTGVVIGFRIRQLSETKQENGSYFHSDVFQKNMHVKHDVVTLMLGTNDCLTWIDKGMIDAYFDADFTRLLRALKKTNSHVIVMTPPRVWVKHRL